MSNPCILCGKQRVNGKSWEEKIGFSTITHTQTLCPDPECQKLLDQQISERKAKNALLVEKKAQAKIARTKMAAS